MHPILLKIGPITLYTYGLCVAVGFLLGSALSLMQSEKQGLSRTDVLDVLVAVLLGGLIGGRMLFVIINAGYFIENPLHVIFINEGGMAFHGGLAGGVIGAAIACRIKNISLFRILDLISPYAALGHAVGRIGCFFNGCCYGKPVAGGIFAVTFPGETLARVPVQIYESISLIILFLVLRVIASRKKFEGQVFSAYLVIYAILRFATESFRDDNPAVFAGMDLPRVISIGMLALGAGMWVYLRGWRKTRN